MKPNEKAIISAKDYGSNKNLTDELTNPNQFKKENQFDMNNNTTIPNKFQFNSRRELLDQSKLSRLPERKPFKMPESSVSNAAAAGCVNCAGRLDPDDAIQQSVKVCRRCLTQYAVIDSAIDDAAKRKRREMLERFAPEVKR